MRPRDSSASPFILSLALHGLAAAALAGGVIHTRDSQAAAALLKPPETMTFRLVDTPEAPEHQPDRPTPLVSERNTRAADRGPRDLPEGAPYSEGRTSLPNPTAGEGGREAAPRPAPVAARAASASAADAGRSPRSEGEAPVLDAGSSAARRSPESLGDPRLQLPREEISNLPTPGTPGRPGLPQVDNRLTHATYEGEFSLSTYAWDYAPYMRRLKRQIEEYTWTILPSAFWYGIAAWATQVRFVILPDGSLETVVITGHEGVLDLRHVAPDAVKGAARFEPLPPGFPEDELTIVGNFFFNVFPPGEEAGEEGAAP